MEERTTFIVNGVEFTDRDHARHYQDLLVVQERAKRVVADYQKLLDECPCSDKEFISTESRVWGREYEDDFGNWHKETIRVKRYQCKVCGREYYQGDIDGEGDKTIVISRPLVKIKKF